MMFCNKCGRQCADGEQYCPQCGNLLTPNAGGGAAQAFITAFNDPLFLVMCILTTISVCNFNVLNLLFAIFMWMVFAKAKNNVCDANSMRCVSGTVFALTVIMWVALGFVVLGGLACMAASGSIEEIFKNAESIGNLGTFAALFSLAGALLFVVLLIFAALLTLINVFVLLPAHKLAKSMYQSAQNGVMMLERVKYTSTAMLVYGILSVVSALSNVGDSSVAALIFSLCGNAVWIVASVWIKKHFLNTNDGVNNYQF